MLKRISALFIGVALLALPAALPTFAQDAPAKTKTKEKAKSADHHEAEGTESTEKPAKEKKAKKEKKSADKTKEEKKTP